MRRKNVGMMALAGVLLATGLLLAADKKGRSRKPKANLPAGYRELNLKPDQREKISEIQAKTRAKSQALWKEIQELKKAESAEMESLLDTEQKAKLKEYRDKARAKAEVIRDKAREKARARKKAEREKAKANQDTKKKERADKKNADKKRPDDNKTDDKKDDGSRKKPEVKPEEKKSDEKK